MADVNKIQLPDNSVVNIKDYRIPGVDSTPTLGSDNVVTSDGIASAIPSTYAGSPTAGGFANKTVAIPFGEVDSDSTATNIKATVDNFPDELADGVCAYIRNDVIASASGWTLNVNGTGAKPVYQSLADASRTTTVFAATSTYLFVYNSSRVSGGCWDIYYGYNSNDNTIGYNLRTNGGTAVAAAKFYRYRILFTSPDGQSLVPANTSTSTNATAARDVNQSKIDPFGPIWYYSTTTAIEANAGVSASYLWLQYSGISLGYAFNWTGAALTMTARYPVYLKCAPQSDGSAIMDANTPIVQALPSTEDGKIYIFLGYAESATNITLYYWHPVYYYKGGTIRQWTNTEDNNVKYTAQSLSDAQKEQARTNIGAGKYTRINSSVSEFDTNRHDALTKEELATLLGISTNDVDTMFSEPIDEICGGEIMHLYEFGTDEYYNWATYRAWEKGFNILYDINGGTYYYYPDRILDSAEDASNKLVYWPDDDQYTTPSEENRVYPSLATIRDVLSMYQAKSDMVKVQWSAVPSTSKYPSEKLVKDSIDAKYTKPSGGIPATDIAPGVIPDVSNFITNSVNNLVNYYSKTEVDSLIGAINEFRYEIAATTSAVSTPESNVLYLIGPTGSGSDKYEEYVYANNTWTKIGDTSIDLSGYITTQALNTALANYTTTTDLTTLLAGKADTATTLAGYGITDANISNGVITLGNNTITPLTSFTETDPTVQSWAKTANGYYIINGGSMPEDPDTDDLSGDKAIPTWHRITSEGYTKNEGTITGITMNGVSKGTSGVVNLGTVVTSESDPTVPSWAKQANKPSYNFSEIGSKPTTISGYGIIDAKIENGTITLGNTTITPLTSFTETDPTVPAWAKASTKPTYNYSEIVDAPTDVAITSSEISTIWNTVMS